MSSPVTTWIKIFFALAGIAGGLALLFYLRDLVQLFLVAAILAYLLAPAADWLEARGWSRSLATTAIFVVILGLLAVLTVLLLPVLVDQVLAFQQSYHPHHVEAWIEGLERWIETELRFLAVRDLDLLSTLQQYVTTHIGNLLDYVPGLFSLLGNLIFIPFVIFFLLRDARRLKKAVIGLVPNRYFEFSLNCLHKIDRQLGQYLRGQLLAAVVVGLLATFAMWLLKVNFFVVIGVFAGLTNLIPFLGPIAGGALAIGLSAISTGSLEQAPGIIVAFLLIQAIDNTVSQPLLIARNVKMHPVLVLTSVIVGGTFFGALGLLLAVPVVAILKVMLQETLFNLRRYRLDQRFHPSDPSASLTAAS